MIYVSSYFRGDFSFAFIKIMDSCRVRREKYVKLSSSSWHCGMVITVGINYLSHNVFVKLNRWAAQVGLDSNSLTRILELPILN
ncbi:hypothetical protein E2C01_028357 [Portunus trituberculatus]|uniref:Uncharacterized protein n=1 Tax=Portunus trituberculatus TaxID=210409 RepID=A0A5B7EL52_PORTR|nr:hypothetical protein [Portunus trituberculatus]